MLPYRWPRTLSFLEKRKKTVSSLMAAQLSLIWWCSLNVNCLFPCEIKGHWLTDLLRLIGKTTFSINCRWYKLLAESGKFEQTSVILSPREHLTVSKMVPTPVKWLAPLELIERQNIFSCHVHDIDINSLHFVLPHGSKVACAHVHSIMSVEWSVPLALPSRDMSAADQSHQMSRYICVRCQFGVWFLVAPWICHNPHVCVRFPRSAWPFERSATEADQVSLHQECGGEQG